MTWPLETILRASFILATGLAAASALKHRPAALRHAVLSGAIFGSALVPAARLLPALIVPVPAASMSIEAPANLSVAPVTAAEGPPRQLERPAGPPAWTIVWSAGCAIVLALLAAGAIRLRRIVSRADILDDARWQQCADDVRTVLGIRARVPLLLTNSEEILATSGILRPRVLLPRTARVWSDDRMRVVLYHELAHVRRRDWAVQVAAEIVRAVCWFNPLAWIACTRLRRESEHSCDDVVVAAGNPPADYAAHLLEIARSCRRPAPLGAAMTMARPSTLHRRIAVMLNSHVDHRPHAPRTLAWIAALAFTAVASIVVLQARQGGPAQLTGTIYDASGAVLPGVEITLRDANGADRTATSDPTGHFEFAAVAAGRYRLMTALPGFRAVDSEFELRNPGDWDRAITLQLGDLQETIHVQAARVGPTQTAPSAGGQPVRVGGNVRAPRKLVDVRPVYPQEMRDAGREGVVPLEAIIRRDGTVGSVRVLSAGVHPDFVVAAVDAVRQWRFSPTLLNGQAVEVVMTVTISFSLAD